jgi:general stress protein 26
LPNRPISEVHSETELDKLIPMIEGVKFAMITTTGPDGALRSRPITTQRPPHGGSFDGTLWFFTGSHTAVATDVRRSPQVNLSYAEPSDSRYISISGTAEISRDRQQMADRWKDLYKAWFPMGLEDPDICLLRITVATAEYWEPPSGKMIQLLGILKAAATGELSLGGTHQVVEFSSARAKVKPNHS